LNISCLTAVVAEQNRGDAMAPMKDSIVRGRLLRLLRDRRAEGPLLFGAGEGAINPPGGIDDRDWLHALAELADHDLVRWKPHPSATGAMLGHAEITDSGLDVCEGRATPHIAIRFY
jgi:hypothetical protein